MADREDKRENDKSRRDSVRRVAPDKDYAGPERRKGDPRLHERRSD